MNYFKLFGFEEKPVIDKAALSEKYIALQKISHPDFFTNGSETEQEEALQQSADINKAYKIFRNSEKTIEYFLHLKGIITADEKYSLPPDFLMEMMDMNESFEESDNGKMQEQLEAYEQELFSGIEPLLSPAAGSYIDAQLQQLKEYYYKKKYLKRILDRLDD